MRVSPPEHGLDALRCGHSDFRDRPDRRAQRIFSPTGVTLRVGSAYSDSASGACSFGGTCEIVVSDQGNPSIGLDEAVDLRHSDGEREEEQPVFRPNYVDKVTTTQLRGW